MMESSIKWIKGLSFKATVRGHELTLDVKPEQGGNDTGPTPKELVLTGIAGCTGMDVVAILKKMRVEVTELDVRVTADVTKDTEPSVFRTVHLTYDCKADNGVADKLKRAVELSQTKYCGVSAMIAKTAPITYDILLNGQQIGLGRSGF